MLFHPGFYNPLSSASSNPSYSTPPSSSFISSSCSSSPSSSSPSPLKPSPKGYGAPIKERMMYSSSKNPLVDGVLVGQMGLAIAKRLEVDSGSEVTRDAIFDEIHPPEEKAKTKFNKPKPPGGRGARYVLRGLDL